MVVLEVGYFWYKIGTGSFFNSFFSTVCVRLEGKKWGSRFPTIMEEFHAGELSHENVKKAKEELKIIKEELSHFPPSDIVWDARDLSKQPPWGDKISAHITDLSIYFVTSDGRDLFDAMFLALEDALEGSKDVLIRSV